MVLKAPPEMVEPRKYSRYGMKRARCKTSQVNLKEDREVGVQALASKL